jgi:hypothetical protein
VEKSSVRGSVMSQTDVAGLLPGAASWPGQLMSPARSQRPAPVLGDPNWLVDLRAFAAADPNAMQADVPAARRLARLLLRDSGDRWRHTVGVADRAQEVADTVHGSAGRDLLTAAAWLHDIGYAPSLRRTGFHPVDGALHLARTGWPARLVGLVAHHSGARFVARAVGLAGVLAQFPREESEVSDALIYADQTTGPQGQRLPIEQRFAEQLARHGPDSPNAAVHHIRGPHLLAAARRVERRRIS